MKAEIVAVGTELLLGQIANTNAQFISEQLAEIGVDVFYHTAVGDNPERLRAAVEIARSRSDVLIFTGGLGPTKDDLTKEVISEMLGRRLVIDRAALSSIEEHFKKTNRPMTENNKKQALVMEGARVLPNEKGMAPGMILETDGVIYILMPGVPSEMKAMFTNAVKPYLSSKVHEPIVSRVLRFFGIGESALETRLADLIDRQSRLTIAPLAKEGEVTLRLTVKHADAHVSQRLLDEAEAEIRARVGDYLYGYGETSLAETVFRLLRERGLTIASAESLTGGLFAERLTDLPGGVGRLCRGRCFLHECGQAKLARRSGRRFKPVWGGERRLRRRNGGQHSAVDGGRPRRQLYGRRRTDAKRRQGSRHGLHRFGGRRGLRSHSSPLCRQSGGDPPPFGFDGIRFDQKAVARAFSAG